MVPSIFRPLILSSFLMKHNRISAARINKYGKRGHQCLTPVWRLNDSAPVWRLNDSAPVWRLNDSAPVLRLNDSAPVWRLNDSAPVWRLNDSEAFPLFMMQLLVSGFEATVE